MKMFVVLLACVWLVAGSPLRPWPLIPHKAITQGSYIRHYTAAWYDTAALREHRSRNRRDASISPRSRGSTLNFRLRALDRVFNMRLVRDTSVFHENALFEGSNDRKISFDSTHTYTGTLEDDENSVVHGVVTAEGLFDGTIFTASDEIYIEPLSRYSTELRCHRNTDYDDDNDDDDDEGEEEKEAKAERKENTVDSSRERRKRNRGASLEGRSDGVECFTGNRTDRHHTIAYSSKDVYVPTSEQRSCASEFLRNNIARKNDTRRSEYEKKEQKEEEDDDNDTRRPFYRHVNEAKSAAKPGFYPMDARKKDSMASSHNLEFLDREVDESSAAGHDERKEVEKKGLPRKVQRLLSRSKVLRLYRERYSRILRKRTSVDPKKTTCMLYLQADHTFFEHYKSEEACIEVMTRHVQRVNSIYRHTDFNQDGQPDNISFMIKRVKVHGEGALQDPTYRFTGNYGVEEFLELFSEEDYDAFCLSYMFTYRDFEKGTLGLAWTGDLKNAGGVCEKNGHYRGSMKSLNTGIITLLNYGKHVPPTVSHVTLAHEIGHNFGSPHDPDECSPGGEDGNFIMFARATSGDKRNNNRFSPCSLVSINPVLNAKARSAKGCFAEPQTAICGNGVVEEGEECDCGWEEDCNDPCCHPQRLHHSPHEIPCRLADGAVCSPSQGPCCTSACTLRNGDKCRDDNGCRDASFCDGHGPRCPPSINKPNKTICNEEFVCYMGECTGSICLAYGLESCQCIAGPEDPPTKSCELCCKLPGEDQPCLSSFAWNSAPYDIPDVLSKPGTPCNDYNGYCDVFQRCREVDPSGPLATLRRLLLSDASLATFQRWITDRWYFVALAILLLLLILFTITRLLSKRRGPRSKKLSTSREISSSVERQATKEESSKERLTASKIQSMNISRIKKRIVETMKSIASPRRKKEESLRTSNCISRVLRLLERQHSNARRVDHSEEEESTEKEPLDGPKTAERTEERMPQAQDKYTLVFPSKRYRTEDLPDSCKRLSLRLTKGNEEEDFCHSYLLDRTNKSEQMQQRISRESTNVAFSKNSLNRQSETLLRTPLKDTPDTPIDTLESRLQTSDLTILLPES